MSKQIETFAVESAEIESPQSESALVETSEQTRRLSLWERGMTTVEYAIGIVLVLTVIGALVLAAKQGWFAELVKVLFTAIFQVVTKQFIP